MNKKLKWVIGVATAAFVVVFAILCIAVSTKNTKIRQQKAVISQQEAVIDSLGSYARELGEMNGISVSVEFTIKNTNVLSFNSTNVQTIAKELASYTRKEVLDSLKNNQSK